MLIVQKTLTNYDASNRGTGFWTSPCLAYGTILCRDQTNHAGGLFHYLAQIRPMNHLGYKWHNMTNPSGAFMLATLLCTHSVGRLFSFKCNIPHPFHQNLNRGTHQSSSQSLIWEGRRRWDSRYSERYALHIIRIETGLTHPFPRAPAGFTNEGYHAVAGMTGLMCTSVTTTRVTIQQSSAWLANLIYI